MAGFSKYLGDLIYKATLAPTGSRANLTAPAATYIALHTAAPNDTSGGSEATYTSYARQAITAVMSESFVDAGSGEIKVTATNNTAITFPASTGADQTVTHWALWDAASGGNLLYSGSFNTSRTVQNGDIVVINSGSLVIELV